MCRPWVHVLGRVQRARQHQQEANEVSLEQLIDKLVLPVPSIHLHAFPAASFHTWICPPFVFLVGFPCFVLCFWAIPASKMQWKTAIDPFCFPSFLRCLFDVSETIAVNEVT